MPVAELLEEALATTRPDAVLVMHTNLGDSETVLDIVTACYDGPVGAYPHEGVWERPDWVFTDITPEDFAARVAPWRERGACRYEDTRSCNAPRSRV